MLYLPENEKVAYPACEIHQQVSIAERQAHRKVATSKLTKTTGRRQLIVAFSDRPTNLALSNLSNNGNRVGLLVAQRRSPCVLLSHLRGGQPSNLVLAEWKQLLGSARIALLDLAEYLRNFGHADQNNAAKQVIPAGGDASGTTVSSPL